MISWTNIENRIDEIIKGAKGVITILFCNINTLKRKEKQSILKFLKKKTKSNILVRILFPLGVGKVLRHIRWRDFSVVCPYCRSRNDSFISKVLLQTV
jgi:hypothetical protein